MNRNYTKHIVTYLLLLAFCSLFISSAGAEEKEKSVIAQGVAPIQGDNLDGAREEALQDALRQALEQGVGMVMDSTSILEDYELMEKVYTHSKGVITSYDILQEQPRGNLFRLKVKAMIDSGALQQTLVELGIIKPMMDFPRVLVLPYPEEAITDTTRAAETMLIKNLTDKKFEVVDPAKSSQLHNEARQLLKVDTINNVAARIGLQHHAEIVLLYRLQSGQVEFDGVMESAPVTVNGQAIVTTTAQILTADRMVVNGMGQSVDLARQNGASRAADDLAQAMMGKIVSWWWDYTANGLPYVLTLHTKPKADMQIISFQQAIEAMPGVVSLAERSSGGGVTEMMVKYKGSSADFKRLIFTRLSSQKGFSNLHTEASKGRFLVLSVL